MKTAHIGLASEYTAALGDYVAQGGEAALLRASGIGRRALAQGWSVLDLSEVYEEALASVLGRVRDASEAMRAAASAAVFFSESLAAFDTAHRGVLEQGGRLGAMGRALGRREAELAALRRDWDQLARAAAHDLQEPVRKILTFGDMLYGHKPEAFDEFMSDCLARIRGAAERMNRLVDGLRQFARAATRSESFVPLDMNRLAQEALFDLSLRVVQAGGKLEIGSLPSVTGDASLLSDLLRHLVDNALKFRGAAPPRVSVSAEPRGGDWLFRVADNGIGIAPEQSERIFSPFERLHARAEYPGVGIGLAVCRRVVERHGGRLWVESRPGAGSTFCFTLPREAGEDGAA